jgi:hypothetical protein
VTLLTNIRTSYEHRTEISGASGIPPTSALTKPNDFEKKVQEQYKNPGDHIINLAVQAGRESRGTIFMSCTNIMFAIALKTIKAEPSEHAYEFERTLYHPSPSIQIVLND